MELSRFIVKRAPTPDAVPPEVMRRFVCEMLVISKLEERRLCGRRGPGRPGTMPARPWMAGSNARACSLALLTDPGAANRWKEAGTGEMTDREPDPATHRALSAGHGRTGHHRSDGKAKQTMAKVRSRPFRSSRDLPMSEMVGQTRRQGCVRNLKPMSAEPRKFHQRQAPQSGRDRRLSFNVLGT